MTAALGQVRVISITEIAGCSILLHLAEPPPREEAVRCSLQSHDC
jgi:hypothetical protein